MKAASISDIKNELSALKPSRLLELTLRLARFKKDNKELLTYLLFESGDEGAYISSVKSEVERLFKELNRNTKYLLKKSLRKILRMMNKFIRYSSIRQTEVELRIYYCNMIILNGISVRKSKELTNLYNNELKKINAAVALLHEDLQFDYAADIEKLSTLP